LPALARSELTRLHKTIADLKGESSNDVTGAHLADIKMRIDQALDPRGTSRSVAQSTTAADNTAE
jgi:hypothetical protein